MTDNPQKEKTPDQEGFSNAQMITRPDNTLQAEDLIARAIEKKTPVETMERLLAMRRELKAEAAKEAFDIAMAKFQSECPVIEKKKRVSFGTTNYSYAPLDEIVSQIKDIISSNGFSYTFDTKQTDQAMTIFCKVKHEMGHMEVSEFEIGIDTTSKMNKSQQFGSALTYGKRYAFCNAFGILTGDEDDDANVTSDQKPGQVRSQTPSPAKTATTPEQAAKIMEGEVVQEDRPLTKSQGDTIVKIMAEKNVPRAQMFALPNGAKKPVEKLTMREASAVIKALIAMPKHEVKA